MRILGADLVVATWVAALAGAILHLAGLSDVPLRVSGLPATSTTTEVSVAAWASSPVIMTTGATATPITIPTAVIRPGTDIRQHQRSEHLALPLPKTNRGGYSPKSIQPGAVPRFSGLMLGLVGPRS